MSLQSTNNKVQTIESFIDKLFGEKSSEVKVKIAYEAREFMKQFRGISPFLDYHPMLLENIGLIDSEAKDKHTQELAIEKIAQIRAGQEYNGQIINSPDKSRDHMDDRSFTYTYENLKLSEFTNSIPSLIKRDYIDQQNPPPNASAFTKESIQKLAEAHIYELTELFHRMNKINHPDIEPLNFANNNIAEITKMLYKQIDNLDVALSTKNKLFKLMDKRKAQAEGKFTYSEKSVEVKL